jgi:hypothetical protein
MGGEWESWRREIRLRCWSRVRDGKGDVNPPASSKLEVARIWSGHDPSFSK